jgi:DNA-binding response OmpR family regulator
MSAKKKSGNDEWKIVIVEDSPTQAEQLKYILETHGYQVIAASNGREALALLGSDKPNLVISDIVMPEMDGYELCKQIKTDEKLKDIPVILLTALSDPADVIRGLECGADNFLTKPYDERVLFSRIEYLRLNWRLPESKQVQMGVEITFSGQKYFITSDRLQILNLLLSTYEAAVSKNRELVQAQGELRRLNEQLEQHVKARTAELVKANKELKLEITERKRVEKRLWDSMSNFHTVVDNSSDGILVTSQEGIVRYINPAAEILFARTSEDIKGEQFGFPISSGQKTEIDIVHEAGEPVVAEMSVTETVWYDEISYLISLHDITERKQAQQTQERLSQQLQAQVSELETFSYGIAHDLRSPMVSIEGFSRLLRDDMRNQKEENVQEDIRLLESGVVVNQRNGTLFEPNTLA